MTKQSSNTTQTTTTTKPKEAKVTAIPKEAQKGVWKDISERKLANLIPNKNKFGSDCYVSREFNGILDLDILGHAFRERHNVLLYGPTGSAKTSLVLAFAANNNLPVAQVPCNGAAEPRNIIGSWKPQSDKTLDFVPGSAALVARYGGIIYLDEVNFMPSKIAAFIHGWLDKRRMVVIPDAEGSSFPSEYEMSPDTMIVAAYNPDYHGTRPLNQAFKNRFKYKLAYPYNGEVEKELVVSGRLLELADSLRKQVDSGNLSTPISTNMLMEFEETVENIGFDFACTNFVSAFDLDESQVVREVLTTSCEGIYDDLVGDDKFADSDWYQGAAAKKTTN